MIRPTERRVVIGVIEFVVCVFVYDVYGSTAQKQTSPTSKVETILEPEAIREAEQRLTDLGYWTGPIDQSVDSLFSYFDPEPLAAASIGQAHAARLKDGTEVVVKVRRPAVVQQVEEDLDILQHLAAAAARRWSVAKHYDVVGLAQEFAQTLRTELDYAREGHNTERFAENFSGDPSVHIPRIYWELTTARVLTLERIRGVKINELSATGDKENDRKAFARHATGVLHY